MKNLLLTSIALLGIIYLTSCTDENAIDTKQAAKFSTASGTLVLKLDGETINFNIDNILLPYAFYCEDESKINCAVEISGKSDNHMVSLGIRNWEKGSHSFDMSDSSGSNLGLNTLLVARKDRTNPFDFDFGFGLKNSVWNVITLQNFTLPDRDKATGEWKQQGKFDKMEVTFEATDKKDKKVTEGYMDISFK